MNCPFCKISSMRTVTAGGRDIDRCMTCGALWFDTAEIRELTEGRVPFEGDHAETGREIAAEPAGQGAAPAVSAPGPSCHPGSRGTCPSVDGAALGHR